MGNNQSQQENFDISKDMYDYCLYDDARGLEYCLKNGADPNKKDINGMRPIEYASSFECIKLLLEAGAEPDVFFETNGSTPLQRSSIRNHNDVVKILLKYGSNPNIPNMVGLTALDHAVHACNLNESAELVETLVAHGANVNHQDASGLTALHRAVMFDNIHLVRLLLEHGADPLIKTKYDKTALEMSTYFGFHDVMNLLHQKIGIISTV